MTRCDLSEREQSGSRSSQTADGGVYIQGGFSINVIKQDAHFLNVKINQHIVDIGASGLYPRPSIMGWFPYMDWIAWVLIRFSLWVSAEHVDTFNETEGDQLPGYEIFFE